MTQILSWGLIFAIGRLPHSNLFYPEQGKGNFPHRLRNAVSILWPVDRGPWHEGISRSQTHQQES